MTAHVAVLFFMLCTSPSQDHEECEEGTIWARSCAVAERHLRDMMRAGQTLHVWACEVRE